MNEQKKFLPEWYPQDAIMLTWPHKNSDWADNLTSVEKVYFELVKTIAEVEKVVIIFQDAKHQNHIIEQLTPIPQLDKQIIWVQAAANDTWARDHGPICVQDPEQNIIAYNFIFNGWGNKFDAELDNQINQNLFLQLKTKHHNIPLVLEGGSIETDGDGTLLTTKACLLNPNRNPEITADELEQQLKSLFSVEQILWLANGELAGDDTDAHIDTLARFAPGHTIIYQGCQDPHDHHYSALQKMAHQLTDFRDIHQQPYQLFELPWPSAQYNNEQQRLPATYANFLFINQKVLLPVYGVEQDQAAIEVMQNALPNHQIVAINCRPIIEQFGSLHCLTMQLPQGFLSSEV
ncbi:agmatine deiminase family protein [Gayadomonas joobiniege]|uniref:agmatine deiminase family protein n=1 Tax=Gayadomonas joobiniege TaxID=1234606 RepID=UPI00036F56FD|nr:agmatine deiminase family protein [Gayadomonas joobiniege]